MKRPLAITVLALLGLALGGCGDVRATAHKDSAVRLCKARANSAGLDLGRNGIRSVTYSGPDTGGYSVAVAVGGHRLLCTLKAEADGPVIVATAWDGEPFALGDRWDKGTGKWVRADPLTAPAPITAAPVARAPGA